MARLVMKRLVKIGTHVLLGGIYAALLGFTHYRVGHEAAVLLGLALILAGIAMLDWKE